MCAVGMRRENFFFIFFYEYKFTAENKKKQKKTFTRHLGT